MRVHASPRCVGLAASKTPSSTSGLLLAIGAAPESNRPSRWICTTAQVLKSWGPNASDTAPTLACGSLRPACHGVCHSQSETDFRLARLRAGCHATGRLPKSTRRGCGRHCYRDTSLEEARRALARWVAQRLRRTRRQPNPSYVANTRKDAGRYAPGQEDQTNARPAPNAPNLAPRSTRQPRFAGSALTRLDGPPRDGQTALIGAGWLSRGGSARDETEDWVPREFCRNFLVG